MSPELAKCLAAVIPPLLVAFVAIQLAFSFWRMNRKYRRFIAANRDFDAAMEQLRLARTDEERLIRGQRAEECLEMMDAIQKEP